MLYFETTVNVERTDIKNINGETIGGTLTAPNNNKRYNMKGLIRNITAFESEYPHSVNIPIEQMSY